MDCWSVAMRNTEMYRVAARKKKPKRQTHLSHGGQKPLRVEEPSHPEDVRPSFKAPGPELAVALEQVCVPESQRRGIPGNLRHERENQLSGPSCRCFRERQSCRILWKMKSSAKHSIVYRGRTRGRLHKRWAYARPLRRSFTPRRA